MQARSGLRCLPQQPAVCYHGSSLVGHTGGLVSHIPSQQHSSQSDSEPESDTKMSIKWFSLDLSDSSEGAELFTSESWDEASVLSWITTVPASFPDVLSGSFWAVFLAEKM